MTRTFLRLALGASFTVLALSNYAAAQGRGGGSRGGGGGMQRGGGGGGGMERGGGAYGGGGMNHSPSFSQPRPQGGSESGNRPPSSGSGNTANAGNRNSSSSNPNAGAAAAGAGYSNRNQSSSPSNAGAAAAGAGAANRNQSSGVSNAGAAAAGAGYSNRNQSGVSNAGAAAAGAGYANRNQSPYSNAGAAAAGAGYANRNNYDQYHPGMAGGYWNGNYGYPSVGAYGGMGMASPSYGYGTTPYMNPYAGAGMGGVGGGGGQGNVQGANSAPSNYSQPLNTSAAPPDTPPPTDPNTSPAGQARQAFQAGDYAGAIQLTQQALGQLPNDVSLHEFLALALFAQGSYEQAAAPLYAVLSVGPGWNWTTLIGNYSDASVYTTQIRGLEAFVKANPRSAKAQFVLAYHYICQGQGGAAIQPLKNVVALQPSDRLSAQILSTLEPPTTASTVAAQPVDVGKLPGVWVAQAPQNATITLTISDDTNFTWAFTAPNQQPVTIRGTFALANGVLTLSGKDTPGGPLVGQVTSPDDNHMTFKAVGGPSSDPGLQFAR